MATSTPVPGETLTRRAVTVITTLIAIMTFLFSFGDVTELCLRLGITAAIAWPVGAAVDLSVGGLLTGVRFLSLHGYTDAQLRKPRRMLLFCGFLTLALNTADALSRRDLGTALVDAVGPVLLIGWSKVGPWMLRQIYTVSATPDPADEPRKPRTTAGVLERAPSLRPRARRPAPRADGPTYLAGHAAGRVADRPGPRVRSDQGRPRSADRRGPCGSRVNAGCGGRGVCSSSRAGPLPCTGRHRPAQGSRGGPGAG